MILLSFKFDNFGLKFGDMMRRIRGCYRKKNNAKAMESTGFLYSLKEPAMSCVCCCLKAFLIVMKAYLIVSDGIFFSFLGILSLVYPRRPLRIIYLR